MSERDFVSLNFRPRLKLMALTTFFWTGDYEKGYVEQLNLPSVVEQAYGKYEGLPEIEVNQIAESIAVDGCSGWHTTGGECVHQVSAWADFFRVKAHPVGTFHNQSQPTNVDLILAN